jgi:uncharacterized protein (TIGR02271 family)
MTTIDQLRQMQGNSVVAQDGEQIGKIEEIFVDYETREPEWLGIGTGLLRTKRVVVPVAGAEIDNDIVRIPYSAEIVKSSPDVDDDQIPQEVEAELYSYYGVPSSTERSDSRLAEGAPTMGAATGSGESMTRSEEELRVGTRSTEAGRVRLRKYVETEPETQNVEVSYETAEVERRPINRPADSGEIGEQELEMPLTMEQPVVTKETVAKEEVSLRKQQQTTQQQVTENVRKERVDVDGDGVEDTP